MQAKKRALVENFSDLKLHQTQFCCPRCDASKRASSLHLQQKTQIDCKKGQRTEVGETFRAVPACLFHWWSQRTWYLPAARIEVKAPGGAGPGSQETRSHDLPVLAASSKSAAKTLHQLGQEILQNHAKGVSPGEDLQHFKSFA
ncbi:uncharacterized protein [Syngnathus scovelli]|uniref:uncharacterized protein isoform X5 n=1 Tax=Syngnathus scovelli TaxID=161590 RepID=UPI0035CBA020